MYLSHETHHTLLLFDPSPGAEEDDKDAYTISCRYLLKFASHHENDLSLKTACHGKVIRPGTKMNTHFQSKL